ncbi:MAG: hypothetical protein AAF570_21245, partial [Bacteroidota bacterium]
MVYLLTEPYRGGIQGNPVPDPAPPPYLPVNWAIPFSLADIIGGTPPMAIDSSTGLLTAIPDIPGQFVFSVSVFEYRGDSLLSEVKRDYQLNVMNCPRNNPPQIIQPTGPQVNGDTLIFITEQDNCFQVTVVDQNFGTGVDSVMIEGTGDIFGDGNFPGPYATMADSGLSPLTTDLCWHPLCHQAGTIHQIILPAEDDWDCPEPHQVEKILYAKVVPAPPSPPNVRCVSVLDTNAISVTWVNPPETRLNGFNAYGLYRSDGSAWTQIAVLPDSLTSTYVDTTISDAFTQSYCYRLTTIKDCPNFLEGEPGDSACSIILDVLKINQVQSRVSWNPYLVWPNPIYEFYGDSTGTLFPIDTLDVTSTIYTQCFARARFRVRTIDPVTGCEVWSGYSAEAVHYDSVPAPIEICAVSVLDGDRALEINWEGAIDDDLVAVRLFRKRDDEVVWEKLRDDQNFTVRSYTDQGLDCDAHAYCYFLELEDFCGNFVYSDTTCSILLNVENQ